MGKRRSVIRQAINRVLMSGNPSAYVIAYVDRDPVRGQSIAEVGGDRVIGVSEWAMTLDDDTVIPLHRVVEVRGRDGRILWRRGRVAGGQGAGL